MNARLQAPAVRASAKSASASERGWGPASMGKDATEVEV